MNDEVISVFGFIVRETPKAVLFLHQPGESPAWLPKSMIGIRRGGD
jgi:hypothetical protein